MSQPERFYALRQSYQYDAADRLIAVQSPSQSASRRFYSSVGLGNELTGDEQRSYLNLAGQLVGIREQQSGPAAVRLFGTEQQGGVLQVLGEQGQQRLAYTPHGDGADRLLPGFNGELPDPLTGHYLLGNGYRAYNPTLLRFHSPDGFSPFSGGGLNSYSYCLGDPVNRADPTGHLSWQAGVGIGLGIFGLLSGGHGLVFGGIALSSGLSAASVAMVVSGAAGLGAAGAGVAQAVIAESQPNSAAAATLGWIALGLGAASAVAGMATSQWSPANQLKPPQVSRLAGELKLGPTREEIWRVAHFGPFPSSVSEVGATRALMRMLNADDLTALASTSTAMRSVVYNSVRPMDSLVRQGRPLAELMSMVEIIGAGQMPGMLPMQLWRYGLTPIGAEAMIAESPSLNLPELVQARAIRNTAGVDRQRRLRERFAQPESRR